eukprot:358518-Chlamydomonas_euryale.AAC.1
MFDHNSVNSADTDEGRHDGDLRGRLSSPQKLPVASVGASSAHPLVPACSQRSSIMFRQMLNTRSAGDRCRDD